MLLRAASALLCLAAAASRSVRATKDDRVLAPAQSAVQVPLPFCDAVLCLPKRRFWRRSDYCSAPHSVKSVACFAPVWAASDTNFDSLPVPDTAVTTMGAFCAAADYVTLTVGDFPARPFLPHNDPDYRGEKKWCKPKRGLVPLLLSAGARQVVSCDLRGAGESTNAFASYTPVDTGRDVATVRALNLDNVVLVGGSMAAASVAWAAAELLATGGARVAGVVMLAVCVGPRDAVWGAHAAERAAHRLLGRECMGVLLPHPLR